MHCSTLLRINRGYLSRYRKLYTGLFLCSVLLSASALLSAPLSASESLHYQFRGHVKGQLNYQDYADDSLTHTLGYSHIFDTNSDIRLVYSAELDHWQADVDYQLITLAGDSRKLASQLPVAPVDSLLPGGNVINDDYRLFDLTHTITEQDNLALVHRLDRATLSYSTDNAVIKVGRQAISWGNGLIYTPMDFFNPFSPDAVDKEYKTGDDMLYGQYLADSGDDLQFVWVGRRDAQGDTSSAVDSLALKYHLFSGEYEWDMLLAEHFDDHIAGLGMLTNIGGAVWRSDVTLTDTDEKTVWSFVTNWSYSWVMAERNVSAVLEYFYNGFGQVDANYSSSALADNSALLERLARGESYTLGRQYVATSLTIEMSPLWLLTPNAFINMSDHSALLQLVSQHDVAQDLQLLLSANIPVGPRGTEFGGIPFDISAFATTFGPSEPVYLSAEFGVFAQLAWYF